MDQTFMFFIGLALGLAATYLVKSYRRQTSQKLITQQAAQKDRNLQQVMDLADTKDKITNNDVEKLLNISDASAERYLNELEAAGKLRQVGATGKYTYYEKT